MFLFQIRHINQNPNHNNTKNYLAMLKHNYTAHHVEKVSIFTIRPSNFKFNPL